jgi:hypothetical protein
MTLARGNQVLLVLSHTKQGIVLKLDVTKAGFKDGDELVNALDDTDKLTVADGQVDIVTQKNEGPKIYVKSA